MLDLGTKRHGLARERERERGKGGVPIAQAPINADYAFRHVIGFGFLRL